MKPNDGQLSPIQFEKLFPFHFRVDPKGNIVHLGPSLKKLIGQLPVPDKFQALFKFLRPKGQMFDGSIRLLEGEMVSLEICGRDAELMGQVMHLADSDQYLFVVSLSVQEPEEVVALGLTFEDFAIQDQIFDFLMLLQTHRRAVAEAERLTKSVVEAHEMALRASQMKSQFLANMSHELRTPMNGVLGMASVLKETDLDEVQKDCVHTIVESGEGMLSLVNDILDLSKIESGHFVLEKFPLSVARVVDNVVQILRPAVDKKQLLLTVDMDASIPERMLGDEDRLRQVLLNLASNAVKFTAQGSVSIRVSQDADRKLRFTVRDTGVGISPEVLGQLFQPFIQGDSSMNKRFGGTGLGLSICKKLVEAMGGLCGVHSELGRGSTFYFTVQLETAPAVQKSA